MEEKWMINNVKTCAGMYIKNGISLKKDFHYLYKAVPGTRKRRHFARKKADNKLKKDKKKNDISPGEVRPDAFPSVELLSNPSSFAVYSQVRSLVLETIVSKCQSIYLNSTQFHSLDQDSDDENESVRDAIIEVPKVVGLGLISVYELIRGSVSSFPDLCIKALEALLDVLQGQQPEALNKEPTEVIDTLFQLLLCLATPKNKDELDDPSSPLVGVACACLLSLVVARGEIGKFLRATADILMTSKQLASQNIQVPIILMLLQRSVHAILLGTTQKPDWFQLGIPKSCLTEQFTVKLHCDDERAAMASDGHYLFVHSKLGLYKIGSGFGETRQGHIYLHRPDFYTNQLGWLGFANGDLLFRPNGGSPELMVVDREELKVREVSQCTERGWERGLTFSDGTYIGNIIPDREDGFVIRTYNPQVKPMPLVNEVSISLAEHCIHIFGASEGHLTPGVEEEFNQILAGKDFVLGKTANGRVYYSGKGSSLGMKQSSSNTNSDRKASSPSDRGGTNSSSRWSELIISKSPKIVQISVGHEGQHAILLSDEGVAYFGGVSKRGEDGESNKARRQPKPTKPKKMFKMDGYFVVTSAANNGTSALVTRDGELYLFGKDTFSCEPLSGLATDLKDIHVASVALGKAHVIALSNKGVVYSFGINNKGQCGRNFSQTPKEPPVAQAVTLPMTAEDDQEEEEGIESGEECVEWSMCPPTRHKWTRDVCMVCTICHECSGYGAACVSSGRPNRIPGQPCGCGSGDSGCVECGCCRICADEKEDDSDHLPIIQPLGLLHDLGNLFGAPRPEQRRNQSREVQNKIAAPIVSSADKKVVIAEEGIGSDQEKENKIGSITPAKVLLPTSSPVVQIACGLHHTLVLCSNGEVYSWGSNSYGQLGTGDILSHGAPSLVRLPPTLRVVNIAAGSNHSILLTSNGQIHTFGSYQKGQLGREAPQFDAGEGSSRGRAPFYSVPSPIPGIGPRTGKRATWVGAFADSTYVKLDQSLINAHNLQSSNVIANSNCLILLPVAKKGRNEENPWKSLLISRSEGQCKSYNCDSQSDFKGQTICLDPVYNVIWSYEPVNQEVSCYNIVAAKAQRMSANDFHDGHRDVLSSALSLPIMPHFTISRAQVALHMLSCIDTITWARENGLSVQEDDLQNMSVSRGYMKEDFVPVNRFESHGGGWGYSGHSIEAIRFMCDTDVLIGGFGLFGGRGEYLAKIKLIELGTDGGDQEIEGELLAETEETAYECGARQKFAMLFDELVPIQANKWYVALSRVSGPSSDCGSSGQSMVTTEDQVIFYFKSSKKSNNGTDVNAGQIPQLLYRMISLEAKRQCKSSSLDEPVPILSKKFAMNVSNDVFQSLLSLLHWSWDTLCSFMNEPRHKANLVCSDVQTMGKLELQRLVYICNSCLRLLRIYVNEIYPASSKSKTMSEKVNLAESVGEVRHHLREMLSNPILSPSSTGRKGKKQQKEITQLSSMLVTVLDECHTTFVSCFHAFYPTGQLKWSCLCDLLLSRDEGCEESHGSDRLLSAVLASLCSPNIKLRATCPIVNDQESDMNQRVSPADNAALSTLQPGDLYRYPILVEQMTYKIEANNGVGMSWTFREVLDRLLGIICGGIRQALRGERVVPLPSLVTNTCLLLLAVVSEFAAETTASENELPAGGRILHVSPCRFTRMSQSRTWSTGNGSPDAISFTVNKSGILIVGVCVYGGVGTYDYELELLDENPSSGAGNRPQDASSHAPTERWSVVELTRGSFGPDDSVADIVEIKFDRPAPIKEGVKYAIRLTNRGGRTSNGDGGSGKVKCVDGTSFTFSACSLSANGTSQIRGQIPQLLYFSTPQDPENQQTTKEIAEHQARKSTLTIVGSILRAATELMIMGLGVGDDVAIKVLSSDPLLTTLLPLILAHIKPVAVSDPRSAVAVISLIQEILPHVSALNNLSLATQNCGANDLTDEMHTTTSQHYAWVESDHPYKQSTVSNYKVSFPPSVQWVGLEFDSQCGTAQPEDSLQIFISCEPSGDDCNEAEVEKLDKSKISPVWIPMNKYSGSKYWPKQKLVYPGNQLVFSLETASDYVKEGKASTFGFKVLVIGYEWPVASQDAIKHLEKELAYLGGLCVASLIKKSLVLPPIPGEDPEEDMDSIEEISNQIYMAHPTLLSKGFALSHPPTIHQTLDGVIPFSCHSNERLFLRDFVSCTGGTSGGRLARWLQPDSYVDIRCCEVLYSKDDLRAGWPSLVTIVTRDQYNEVVHAPGMKVEVTAVPVSTGEDDTKNKVRRCSQFISDNMTFGGHPQPSLDTPYQVSIKDKMCYCAISIMKSYENYSFEELRYVSPAIRRPSENMLVRSNNDGSYSCNWTPSAVGWYSLNIKIDGYHIEKVYKLEVKDPPQGIVPPIQTAEKRPAQVPSKLRKFVLPNSAGLRIRAHPALQSEQLGIIPVNGTIAYVDEIHNNDGVWLQLSKESVRQYCKSGYAEAWCLQYNQHLGKTLLVPLDQPKSILEQVITDTISKRGGTTDSFSGEAARSRSQFDKRKNVYTVIKCGVSGHNIRSKPNLRAPPVGMLVLGNTFSVDIEKKIADGTGTWVRLDCESTRRFCFTEGEAWSLAVSKGQTMYLQCSLDGGRFAVDQANGFDFTRAQSNPVLKSFQPNSVDKSPFVFGSSALRNDSSGCSKSLSISRMESNYSPLNEDLLDDERPPRISRSLKVDRWAAKNEGYVQSPPNEKIKSVPMAIIDSTKDLPPELQGVSVKELVKAIGESRANGNGATPPRTPPATPKRSSSSSRPPLGSSPKSHSPRCSSPISIHGRENASTSPLRGGRLISMEDEGGGGAVGEDNKCGKSPSLTDDRETKSENNLVISNSPAINREMKPRRHRSGDAGSLKIMTQTATQTSPPEGVRFSIGSCREENLSPKNIRKDRSSKPLRSKKERSPSVSQRDKFSSQNKVKEAMSPSVAECLRAIFAAFLWHEGIVHDAMACASYLKFHPDLVKQGTLMWKLCQQKVAPSKPATKRLTKEQKARQRHSVEVSAYYYLNNVTVQNTGDLQKIGTNANIVEAKDEANKELFQGASQGIKLATVLEAGGASSQSATELPLVLRYVVMLWEDLSASCHKAIGQTVVLPSPTTRMKKSDKSKGEKKRSGKKKSTSKLANDVNNPPSAAANPPPANDAAAADEVAGGSSLQCELCYEFFSSEQHYATAHPGCGGAAHGCGYVGARWKFFPTKDHLPMTCGEKTRGCYHMCWSCRNKYKKNDPNNISKKVKKKVVRTPTSNNVDTHVIMRNNAMFLLDLASASSVSILNKCHTARRSLNSMPCVSELSPDSCPFPKVAFQCLHTLNCQQQHLNQLKEDLLLQQHALNSSDANNGYYTSSGESRDNQREGLGYSPGTSHQDSPGSDPEVSWGRPFHRSISVTVAPSLGQDWNAAALAESAQNENNVGSGVVMRKRNNSSSENPGTGVNSLLAHPSASLEKLMTQSKESSGRLKPIILRPIMAFIFQNHDLETLAFAMRHATRKAAARVYAMQALNWLLKSVSQPTCLHDLLWCFVTALTPNQKASPPSPEQNEEQAKEDYHDLDGEMTVLEHPLSDVTLSGDAVHPLPSTFHQLLQTIADLMMLLPPGSSLQMMAVRCWGLRFSPSDHDFLHQSHVFSNISKILSRSEEVLDANDDGSNSFYDNHGEPVSSEVESLVDQTPDCEIKTSSRQAMISSLTDSSTETFWESGDEDRNKTKSISIFPPPNIDTKIIYVHIDNSRDLGNKVTTVIFKYGPSVEEVSVIRLVELENRFTGWVHAYIPTCKLNCIVIDLRGPDQSVRVRQIRVMGPNKKAENESPRLSKGISALALQHRACEQETLKVFRLITGQVFGRLLKNSVPSNRNGSEEETVKSPVDMTEDADHNNDLREHMVGILFSRSKLNHLQKQVCAHIVQAIKKEAKKAREEWENSVSNDRFVSPDEGDHPSSSDTYCFEMLSMVLALSGSAVGRAHLAHQENLLKHLLSLLHTGSARVQRQVVSLFRRMLFDITPATLAQVLGVQDLPIVDLTVLQVPNQESEDVFDMHRQGIIDVFLAVIAKSLIVQIKNKGNEIKTTSPEISNKIGITSVTLSSVRPTSTSCRWWLKGNATNNLADLIICLIRDMTNGKISENWLHVSKGAIAENIINLTRMHEKDRPNLITCLSTPTLWMALASLCVLHPDHIDALSSQQWRSKEGQADSKENSKPMCENHDDGSTTAMILCDSCGNLCGDCDKVLHLHRKTRTHHRTVFREEQQAIKVDLHEGCGRTKLFWLLALADSTTLKAMIELRGENSRTRGPPGSSTTSCRFCCAPAQSSLLCPIPVCQEAECQEYSLDACTRVHKCGHVCGGIKNEGDCLPCLIGCDEDPTLKQDADDMCMVCFCEALSAAPSIQLECCHVFHLHCCRSVLAKRWPGPRITFTFSMCPICKVSIKHWSMAELLQPITVLYDDVRRKALMRLEYEGLLKAEVMSSTGTKYFNDPASYAMDRYAYYVCFKCNKAYYGGEARCENEAGANDDYDPQELVCGGCSDVSRAQMCPKHGTDYLEYKCRYCCSVAVFFCFGTTHFCNACHEDFQRVTNIAKGELPRCPAGSRSQQLTGEECPLHVQHPATGEEFALGCGVCRNAHTF